MGPLQGFFLGLAASVSIGVTMMKKKINSAAEDVKALLDEAEDNVELGMLPGRAGVPTMMATTDSGRAGVPTMQFFGGKAASAPAAKKPAAKKPAAKKAAAKKAPPKKAPPKTASRPSRTVSRPGGFSPESDIGVT